MVFLPVVDSWIWACYSRSLFEAWSDSSGRHDGDITFTEWEIVIPGQGAFLKVNAEMVAVGIVYSSSHRGLTGSSDRFPRLYHPYKHWLHFTIVPTLRV